MRHGFRYIGRQVGAGAPGTLSVVCTFTPGWGDTVNILKLSLAGTLAIGLTVALPGAAAAVPLTITGPVTTNTVGPQSTSNPCIIAGTNCSQPDFMGYNNFTQAGNISSFNMFSTTPTATVADGVQGTPYTVGQLTNGLNSNSFIVAIDVNTTGAAGEMLTAFEVIIGGVVAYNYQGPPLNIGNVGNNGNGFGDYFTSVISLAGLAPSTTVLFHAVWNTASDGAESFFIIPTTSQGNPIPEPASLLLLGTGLSGWALARRRKKAQK